MKNKTNKNTILLVEDEWDLRGLIGRALAREGFSHQDCSTVSEAIKKLGHQRFDLVILDILLRDGTGEDVINYLRNKDHHNMNRETPIFVISGHMDAPLLKKIRKNIDGALVKPLPAIHCLKK